MKVTLLPSAVSGGDAKQLQFLTSYLFNDNLAIDAGSLGLFGTPQEQARIRHVLLSHTHIDHIGSLPIFVENAYLGLRDPVTVHGSEDVLRCLHTDLFNDRLWPDFFRLSNPSAPFLRPATLEPGRPIELEGLHITPVPLDHIVPTLGFIVADALSAVAIVSDTGPSEAIWQLANHTPNLRAVFLEVTFPEAMSGLAALAKHLTPTLFVRELQKLNRRVAVIAVHIKARFRREVVNELNDLGIENLEIGEPGKSYRF